MKRQKNIYYANRCLLVYKIKQKKLLKEYVFQKLKEGQIKLKTFFLSINEIVKDYLRSFRNGLTIPKSSDIIEYCERIIQFDDPFLQNVNKKSLIYKKQK